VSEQSAIDLSGLEDVIESLKSHKNLLIGIALIGMLAIAATSFIRREMRESEIKPWRGVFAGTAPWSAPSEDLASLSANGGVKETPAAPFVKYWEAIRRFDEKDTPRAIEQLSALQSSNPTFLLCSVDMPNPDRPAEPKPVVTRLLTEMQRLDQWGKSYPVPTANPPPHPKHTVTFVTDRGPIILALYDDVSPKSCDAFMATAPLLKDRFIARSNVDQWIELGQEADGTNVVVAEPPADFPPFEENRLSHFPGSVAYRQPPFSKSPLYGDLRIDLKTHFDDDGRSTVFAWVAEGFDVLTGIAKDDHKADTPNSLAAPVKITEVRIEAFDPAKPPAGMRPGATNGGASEDSGDKNK